MRAAEILRQLADIIDKAEDPTQVMAQPAVEIDLETDSEQDDQINVQDVMVPPLQQKMELLKKVSGVNNIYDDGEEPDELDDIKKNAGIMHLHADDSDLAGQ